MMLKITKFKIAATMLASTVLLSGCGLFGGDEKPENIDPPQDVSYLEEGKSLEESAAKEKKQSEANVDDKVASKKTVKQELYLIDKNGYVVPQTFELPKVTGLAKQALEYLVQNGPVQALLPNGFQAVLPPDTQILGVNIKGDTVIADFSQEFANYKPEDEQKILEAITWTLTEFDNIEKVKIRINGHDQNVMPVNHTPIEDGLSRADGINIETNGVVDITNTHPVTVYFMAENSESTYYVPVTRRVENTVKDNFVAVVNELIEGPSYTSGLLDDFNDDVKLLDSPVFKDGNITLNFNESILGSFDEKKKIISNHVIESLVLSLTEQPGVKSVAIKVNGETKLMNEQGKEITVPVTRPENVNTGSF